MNDIPQSTADLLRIPPTPNDVIQDGGEQRSVKPMADENNGDKIRTYTTFLFLNYKIFTVIFPGGVCDSATAVCVIDSIFCPWFDTTRSIRWCGLLHQAEVPQTPGFSGIRYTNNGWVD